MVVKNGCCWHFFTRTWQRWSPWKRGQKTTLVFLKFCLTTAWSIWCVPAYVPISYLLSLSYLCMWTVFPYLTPSVLYTFRNHFSNYIQLFNSNVKNHTTHLPFGFLKISFTVLTILSQNPPHHGAKAAEKFHSMGLRVSRSLNFPLLRIACKYFDTQDNVWALSENILVHPPPTLKNQRSEGM